MRWNGKKLLTVVGGRNIPCFPVLTMQVADDLFSHLQRNRLGTDHVILDFVNIPNVSYGTRQVHLVLPACCFRHIFIEYVGV